ncbi:hypothetical protein KCTCHS21_60640 [Cohnella abietis]|uniref:Uncharacterized protein n=1 Tax=Cohnella abietis TaxID=2507935 RepID=A0A3T1DFJ4_9BACL|nr:hypothetical protein KCTCHS21_60640 [Cohnella abietis]
MDETFRSYFDSSLLDKSLVVWVADCGKKANSLIISAVLRENGLEMD